MGRPRIYSSSDKAERLREAVARYRASQKYKETRRRYETSPEVKAKKLAYDHSPERVAARREYRQTPERKAAERARWANPARRAYVEALRETPQAKARAKTYEEMPHRREDRRARSRARLSTLYKQRCECCSSASIAAFYSDAKSRGLQIDHIVPLAIGGQHCLKNLQALTKSEHKLKTKQDMTKIREAKREAS